MPANPWDIDEEEEDTPTVSSGGVWDVDDEVSAPDPITKAVKETAPSLKDTYEKIKDPATYGKILQGIPTGASLGLTTLDPEEKKLYEKNRDDGAYQLGEALGGFVSPIGKGVGALLDRVKYVKKLYPTIKKTITGATEGAIYGGTTQDSAGKGALVGGAVGGGIPLAGKAIEAIGPQNVAKKIGSVLFGIPDEITETYMRNPAAVKNAPLRHQLATRFQEKIDELQQQVISGSKESRAILDREGATFSRTEIANIFDNMADELTARMEGVNDVTEMVAARSWLKDKANSFRVKQPKEAPSTLIDEFGAPIQTPTQVVDKRVTANKLKDTIQGIQRETDYDAGGGKFVRIPEQDKKRVSALLNEALKAKSPAYRQQMKSVAADTDLLERTTDIAKSPQTMANVFRRIETDKYGPGQLPVDTLGEFDKRMKTDFLGDAKNTAAREAFEKTNTQGSRRVNLFQNMFGTLPMAENFGRAVGATVDRYAGPLGMKGIDAAIWVSGLAKRKDVGGLLSAMNAIKKAADLGDPQAILTMHLLRKNSAEINETLQQSAIEGEP